MICWFSKLIILKRWQTGRPFVKLKCLVLHLTFLTPPPLRRDGTLNMEKDTQRSGSRSTRFQRELKHFSKMLPRHGLTKHSTIWGLCFTFYIWSLESKKSFQRDSSSSSTSLLLFFFTHLKSVTARVAADFQTPTTRAAWTEQNDSRTPEWSSLKAKLVTMSSEKSK